jgi:hypothetical protein
MGDGRSDEGHEGHEGHEALATRLARSSGFTSCDGEVPGFGDVGKEPPLHPRPVIWSILRARHAIVTFALDVPN